MSPAPLAQLGERRSGDWKGPGSIPVSPAPLAQLGERRSGDWKDAGSVPVAPAPLTGLPCWLTGHMSDFCAIPAALEEEEPFRKWECFLYMRGKINNKKAIQAHSIVRRPFVNMFRQNDTSCNWYHQPIGMYNYLFTLFVCHFCYLLHLFIFMLLCYITTFVIYLRRFPI